MNLPSGLFTSPLLTVSSVLAIVVVCVTCASEGDEVKPVPDAPIAPPQANEVPKRDSMLSRLPESSHGDDGEIIMPADSEFAPGRRQVSEMEQRRRDSNVRRTDQEIIGGSQRLDERHAQDIGDIDKALGVTPKEAPGQSPSYTLALQTIKELFQANKYEDALIETNNMLRYYPRSPKLLMMKGTLHQRLGYIDLALTAYIKAYEIEPSKKLKAQIDHLRRLVAERESLRAKPIKGKVASPGAEEVKVIETPEVGAPK